LAGVLLRAIEIDTLDARLDAIELELSKQKGT